jgi:hypothetical protein
MSAPVVSASFWNPGRIYARVGARGFSVTIQHEMPADRVREALITLARAGVERMRALPAR